MKRIFKIIFFITIFLLNTRFIYAAGLGLSTYGIDLLNPSHDYNEIYNAPNSSNAADFLSAKAGSIVSIILGFSALLVFILIIFGGVKILFSNGNKEKYSLGINIIKTTVIGLIIILLSYAITNFFVKNVGNTTGVLNSSNSFCSPACESNQYCCTDKFFGCTTIGQCENIKPGIDYCACSSNNEASCLGICTQCTGTCPTSDRVSNYSGFCTPERTNNLFYCKRR